MRIGYQEDPFKASIILHAEKEDASGHDYSLIISLYQEQPFVEITWAVHSKPSDPWPEAGWITFPLNVKKPEFRLGRLGAIVDPTKDFIEGSNHDYCFFDNVW